MGKDCRLETHAMIPIAVVFSAAMAGASLVLGVVVLMLGNAQDRRRLGWPFALLSLTQAAFALNHVVRNACPDLTTGDVVMRLQGFFSCAVALSCLLVYRRLLSVSGYRFDAVLALVLAGFGLFSLASPAGFSLVSVTSIGHIPAGYWGPLTVLQGDPDPLQAWSSLCFLVVVLRLAWIARQGRHLSDRIQQVVLLVPVAILIFVIIFGFGLVRGWWSGIPLGEYGLATLYGALALAFYRRSREVHLDLARHQQQIAAVLEHGIGFAGLLDPDGRIVLANRTALNFAGVTAAAVTGQYFPDTPWWSHSPSDRARLNQALATARAGTPDRFLATHPKPDGGTIDVDFCVTPYRTAGGTVTYLIIEGRDISELRRLDLQMRERGKLEAIGQLAGGIAHDFNNILAGVMGAAELARLRCTQTEIRGRLDTIISAAAKAGDLTRRLLAFARQGRVQQVPLHANAVAVESIELFRRSGGPGLHITSALGADPDAILGDPAELQSALLNLCCNARDALAPGGEVRVSTGNHRLDATTPDASGHPLAPGDYVCFDIIDTGSGIPPEILHRIFEPFFTSKPVGKGTGLGLPSALGTAHTHGGGLLLRTAPGLGTTVSLLIPVTVGTCAPTPVPLPVGNAHGALLVLVDDEPAILEMARELLTDLGFQVEAHQDALSARDRLRDPAGVRCVMLDLAMPGLDGRALYRQVREVNPALPVIISSGHAGGGANDFADDHCLAFLAKPWRLADLQATLVKLGILVPGT